VNNAGESPLSTEISSRARTLFGKMLDSLLHEDVDDTDYFGYSVAISGDYVAVGSKNKAGGDGGSLIWAGAAYVFHRTGTNAWSQGTKINAPDMDAGDYFGGSVSIREDVLLVGAYAEDNVPCSPLNGTGAAYVFSRTGSNTWDNGAKISCPDPAGNEKFGYSVFLGDGYALIGA